MENKSNNVNNNINKEEVKNHEDRHDDKQPECNDENCSSVSKEEEPNKNVMNKNECKNESTENEIQACIKKLQECSWNNQNECNDESTNNEIKECLKKLQEYCQNNHNKNNNEEENYHQKGKNNDEKHNSSLNQDLKPPAAMLKTKCLEVLKLLQCHEYGWVFNSPVDPVKLKLPDYFQVIKCPMDLGTIEKRIENGYYSSPEEFQSDVFLTFDNAMLYNPKGSIVYNMAKEMKMKFKNDYDNLI